MAKSKHDRQILYTQLLSEHFAPAEAKQFCRLSKRDSALLQMRAERASQYRRFQRRADSHDWRSTKKRHEEWVLTLKRIYRRRGWSVQFAVEGGAKVGDPSPWEWYRGTLDRLPADMRPSQYRKRAVSGKIREVDKRQVHIDRWIRQLSDSIKHSSGAQRQEFVNQRDRLKRLKSKR
jgi:hypothetical protein